MDKYTKEEMKAALKIVSSTIDNCEKVHPKFAEGTSQHTLLINRIKAMYISNALIKEEDVSTRYSQEELTEALRPVSSIISKCEKALSKSAEGSPTYKRLSSIIKAMEISRSLIKKELDKRAL